MVISTPDILSSILLPNPQALQVQQEQLRLCWVCQWVEDHQESSSMCSQERHGGRTLLPDQVAPDSTNSPMYAAPELQGGRPRVRVRCTPPPVFEQCLASWGSGLGEASSCSPRARAAEPNTCRGPGTHTVPVPGSDTHMHMPHTWHSELHWHRLKRSYSNLYLLGFT